METSHDVVGRDQVGIGSEHHASFRESHVACGRVEASFSPVSAPSATTTDYLGRGAQNARNPRPARTPQQGLTCHDMAGAGGYGEHFTWLAVFPWCCNGAHRKRAWRKIGSWCRDWESSD